MEERDALNAAIETIAARFRSGNRIPVDKAQVPADEWHALVAVLASAPAAEPVYFEGYLCKAWGETELPCAEVVADLAGVRRFIVREWICDEKAEDLTAIMADIESHDAKERGPWTSIFEIGGASVEPVYSFAAPQSTPT